MKPIVTIVLMMCGIALLTGCGHQGPPRPPATTVEEVSVSNASANVAAVDALSKVAKTDWPTWRGGNEDGHAPTTAVPTKWSVTENIVWQADVPGRGHSSPVVVGDTVYLASALEDTRKQIVLAYNRATGEKRWETVIHEGNFTAESGMHQKSTHANGTVACNGDAVFVSFLNDDKITLTKLSLTGDIVWQKEIGSFRSKFGYAASPLLYGSTVIVCGDNSGGGYIAAVDRESGDIVWRKSRTAEDTYSTPLLASIGGRDQLVVSGAQAFTSYNPATGETLWTLPHASKATCGTAVTDGQVVLCSGGFPDNETLCVDANGKKIWSDSTRVYEPSLLLVDNYCFAVNDKGVAYCWDKATGKQLWQERLGGGFSSSPVLCDGLIHVSSLKGVTHIFKPDGKSYVEVARNELGTDCYASPAMCDGQIFTRVGTGEGNSRKEKLICIGSK